MNKWLVKTGMVKCGGEGYIFTPDELITIFDKPGL